jgi:alkylated DNA repair dioxygenase AlkB
MAEDEQPAGLVYRPEFLSEVEARELVAILDDLEIGEIRMRGQTARRTARHYGIDYDYDSHDLRAAEPVPSWLLPSRDRAAELARVAPDELAETLVQRYPVGATIGWHRDAPGFGQVVGISLGAPCRMRFRRTTKEGTRNYELELEPRSAYLLAGAARWAWQHSIPPTKGLRYSITFRTLRNATAAPVSASGAA